MADTASATVPVTVVVAVPAGVRTSDVLVATVRELHPDWEVVRVWAGDPQLRPAGAWATPEPTELQRVRVEPEALPVLAAAGVAATLPAERAAIVLTAGSVAVLGGLRGLVPRAGDLLVVPRLLAAPSVDGRYPHLAELAEVGAVTPSVFAVGPGERDALHWIRRQLLAIDPVDAGPLLDLAAQLFPSTRCADPRIGVSVWRWDSDDPVLVDAPGFDPARPWLLDPDLDGLPLVSLADGSRLATMARAASQLGGCTTALTLPGALEIDDVIRALVRRRPDVPDAPWSDAPTFRRWVDLHYWTMLHERRPDVRGAFPSPAGTDADRFAVWARHAAFDGRVPLLVDPSTAAGAAPVVRTADRTDGVNLIGYFRHQSGVANVGRTVAAILERHGIPYTTVAYERTESPLLEPPPSCDQRLEFATSIVFVNGDQFAMFHHDVPEAYGPGRRVIGVWFWELETFDGGPPVGDDHADEVWVTTSFVARAVEELGTVPVRVVPVPYDEPAPTERARHDFAPLATADDRFVFGVVLDHMSITARKNPIAAIRAFERAFAPGEGPLLVVKTINAHRCWHEHEQLRAAAAGRDDIVVWDEHLTRGDHLALIRSFDALVSLHRSEGAGLHLAEAMWMGVPVIATRYSGNLDFMDDRSALLIDAELVAVGSDGGWAYPASARWAEPDLDRAAVAMRRLVDDPAFAAGLGRAGRERMLAEPGEEAFVARLRQLLDLGRPSVQNS